MTRLLSFGLFAILMWSTGCETTYYEGPKSLTWNVTIDSAPPGADLSWRRAGEDIDHPLGKAPVSASIPLPIGQYGHFDRITVSAKAGRAASWVTTSELLGETMGEMEVNAFHSADKAAQLPTKITVNALKNSEFETHARLGMLREFEKNPDMWKPYVTSIEGTVLSVRESRDGCIVQLFVEGQKNVVVYWPGESMPGVNERSLLKVLGRVQGRTSGTNAFGGAISALTFECYGYSVDWLSTYGQTNFVSVRKAVFEKWADGSLFARETPVTADSVDTGSKPPTGPNDYLRRTRSE